MQPPPVPVVLNCRVSPVNVFDGQKKKAVKMGPFYLTGEQHRKEHQECLHTLVQKV